VRLTTSPPSVSRLSRARRLTTLWASTACYRGSFTVYPSPLRCKSEALSLEPNYSVLAASVLRYVDTRDKVVLVAGNEILKACIGLLIECDEM
jgi:hypothetical protein